MLRAYKYKLYHSKRNRKLGQQINIAASVWNHTVALQRRYYKITGKYASANRIKKLYTKLKKLKCFAFWSGLGSQAVQDVVERVDRAYQAFFDYKKGKTSLRKSPPKFKRRQKYKSFTLKQAGYKLFEDQRTIAINGVRFRYHKSRNTEGVIKTITVRRTPVGDYYVAIVCEVPDVQILPRTGKAVGMDFGLKDFLTLDNGTKIESPLWYKNAIFAVKKANRELSKCQKNSNHRRAAKRKLAKVHEHIANQRRDWFFKLAHRLCGEYATICIEDLNLKGMQRLWGRKVSDLAFAEFVQILEYVAFTTGVEVLKVDRWYPSSKLCHVCGTLYSDLTLIEREWTCECRNTHHDRDINAAINIKAVALA